MRRRELLVVLGGLSALRTVSARAQQSSIPVVGVLAATSEARYARIIGAFRKSLSELGHNDGQNVGIIYRWAEGRYERLPALALDLVGRQVSVIATFGGIPAALAAKAATATIPVVFAIAGDPVKLGLVNSIARPTGNATGIGF